MAQHRMSTAAPTGPALDFSALTTELELPGPFPAEVLAVAEASSRAPRLPERDETGLELVTIDPPGATDLDQAVAVERRGDGWRVHYAIADVGAWVAPGDPVDVEARRRTQTHYLPDARVPLHPPVLGEAAASLLPDGPRPAALWTIDVAADGSTVAVDVARAMVRSRAQLTYAEVQAAIDSGRAPAAIAALPALGGALLADARRRDAIELGLPEQEVVPGEDGHWTLRLRADLPVEEWNAQVSLLTGRAAAGLMVDAGVGVLRTLPAPDEALYPRLRRAAAGLDVEWSDGEHPGAVLARLDTSRPRHAAFADLAAELLRGAGYHALDGTVPADPGHAGVGGVYAHVTAPLRRLVDRFTTETCLAVAAGVEVPGWVVEALPEVPVLMAAGDARARRLDRAVIDAAEAFVMSDRVGEIFQATVIETGERHGTVVLDEPPVQARCDDPGLPLGETIEVRCTEADVATRTTRFARVR